ncbi:MAG: VOC family protein [Moraxellaceae bacterium]|nr:MAG: VOC family protein [Moraxellaceae bacterium]
MTTHVTAPTTTTIQPYLFFPGRCEEALEFYRSALGAEIEMLMRFSECPDPQPEGMLQPGWENKVMHASFSVAGNRLMASDGCGEEGAGFAGFSLAINLPTEAEVDRVFAALSEGGTVQMPLGKTFWSPKFGMVTDRFGLGWMVGVAEEARD